jgi:hypothetical protein
MVVSNQVKQNANIATSVKSTSTYRSQIHRGSEAVFSLTLEMFCFIAIRLNDEQTDVRDVSFSDPMVTTQLLYSYETIQRRLFSTDNCGIS